MIPEPVILSCHTEHFGSAQPQLRRGAMGGIISVICTIRGSAFSPFKA